MQCWWAQAPLSIVKKINEKWQTNEDGMIDTSITCLSLFCLIYHKLLAFRDSWWGSYSCTNKNKKSVERIWHTNSSKQMNRKCGDQYVLHQDNKKKIMILPKFKILFFIHEYNEPGCMYGVWASKQVFGMTQKKKKINLSP